jgi:hypothetical protein
VTAASEAANQIPGVQGLATGANARCLLGDTHGFQRQPRSFGERRDLDDMTGPLGPAATSVVSIHTIEPPPAPHRKKAYFS